MARIVFNDYVDAALCAIFIALVLSMVAFGLIAIRAALRNKAVTTREARDELQDLRTAGA
jgi:carbon starvation protein